MDTRLLEVITEKVIKEIKDVKTKNISLKNREVKVGVSNRHIHLSKEHLEILFGYGYELKVKKYLMGDQFAAEEVVTIVGKKLRAIEKVRILGPIRGATQVEISATDSITLGLKAPVRLSGDIKNSESISIVGPKGVVKINEGCIIAKRHIHMNQEDASKMGVKEGISSISFKGERAGILNNVEVRIREDYHLEMHIDTDEANALNIKNGDFVEII